MGCTNYDPLNYEENQKEDYLTKTIFESIMARKKAKIQGEFDAERKEQEDRERELLRQQYLLDSINPRGPKSYVDNLINKEIPKMEFGNLASEEQILDDLNNRECDEYDEGEKVEETEEQMTEGEIKEKQEKNKNEMEELKRQLEELNKKSEGEKGKKTKKKKGEKDGFFGKKKENKEENEDNNENDEKNQDKSELDEEKEEEENEQSKKEKTELNEEEENESNIKPKNKKDKNNKKKKNDKNIEGEDDINENEEIEDNEEEDEKNNKNNKNKSERNKKNEINSKNSQSQHDMKTEEEKEIGNLESEDVESEEKEKKLREKMLEERRLNRQKKMRELMKLKAENPSYADKIKRYKYPKKEIEEKPKIDFSPSPTEIILCVIGEEKNGKSSFIKKYTRNVFEQTYKKTEEIDTYDNIEVEYETKKIKLHIIDTPPLNKRKYTNLIQENMNKSHIIFYIIDINDEYADFKVKLTLQNFEFNEQQIIAIIGNKSDKVSIFAQKNKDSFGILCKARKYIFEVISCQDKPKNELENFMNNKIIKEYFYLYGK